MTNSVPDLRSLALRLLSISLIALLLLLPPALSHADPVVRYAAPAGSGDCSSWADACSLQTALASAGSGDEVWVQMGIHKPTHTTDRTISFALPASVAVYGGFAGTETQLAERDWQTNLTILSGDIDNNDLTDPTGVVTDTANIVGANSFHVVYSLLNDTGRLDGFVITAGDANDDIPPFALGGGMYNEYSSLAVANVTLVGNRAFLGGGMFNYVSSPGLTAVTFHNNSAHDGGGLYSVTSAATLTGVLFSGNAAESDGGGMFNDYQGNPILNDVTFQGNTAVNYGGGMHNDTSTTSPTLVDVTFSQNSALVGGGMFNHVQSTPSLTTVTFSSNQATLDGGGMYNVRSNPLLTDVIFSNNQAIARDGGGLYNNSSSPSLTNVHFTDNIAYQYGGGIYNIYNNNESQSNSRFTNVTINGNMAVYGGGMFNETCEPILTEVLFSGNTAVYGGGMYNTADSDPTLTAVTFTNNWGDFGGGMGNSYNSDPMLTDVTFNGNTGLYGAGMYNDWASDPVLMTVTFANNQANWDGGGLYNDASSPTLTGVTFRDNGVYNGNGGGLHNINGSHPSLVNVVFAGNTANLSGGGVYNTLNSSPTLTNVTFSGNTAVSYDGGALYNGENSNPLLNNSILWGNSAGRNGNEIFNDGGSVPTLAYSDVQGSGGSGSGWDIALGIDGGGNLDADPRFVAPAAGDLHLRPDSPAIDAGDNTAVPPGIVTDLDGRSRFIDVPFIPDSGSGTPPLVDMGAYEASFTDLSLAKTVTPAVAAPGEMLTFTLTLSNRSSLTVTQVVLTDTLPAHLSPQAVLASGVTITDTGVSPAFVWHVADLAPGQTGVITLTAVLTTPLAAGTYTNTAHVSAANDAWPLHNSASITYTVANVAPVFTSTAVLTASQDAPYTYLAAASDGNGDLLTITAPVLPGWLSLTDHGDGTAVLFGTPARADIGEHAVTLRVVDQSGLYSEQTFSVAVLAEPAFALYLPMLVRGAR